MASLENVRKKSPRAPSIPLDEALAKALRIYEKEGLRPTPADLAAQHMGYKDANNGSALSAIASLRYYGLVERHGDGLLSVTKDLENYKFAPNDAMRRAHLRRFVTAPVLFAELLERHASGLPSDSNLRYELVQRGFLPGTGEGLVAVLKRSADFARVYEPQAPESASATAEVEPDGFGPPQAGPATPPRGPAIEADEPSNLDATRHDRIPVRLSGGRRAWLVIPPVFYEADKQRLKAQIDLLLTDEGAL